MTTTMDAAGRPVIPSQIRREAGLEPGVPLEVRTYDAVIAGCGSQARADVLLTCNPRHFQPSPRGVQVVVPSGVARR